MSGVPVDIAHGSYGGVHISDAYKLPVNFLNKAEYRAALDAIQAMRGQIEDAALDSAIEKISSQYKKTDAELPVTAIEELFSATPQAMAVGCIAELVILREIVRLLVHG